MTMEAGKWYQVGCHFETLTDGAADVLLAPEGKFFLNQVFKTGFSSGDEVFLWKTSGAYTYYCYDDEQGWVTEKGDSADENPIDIGRGLLIHKKTESLVTFVGKVLSRETSVTFGNTKGNAWAQINLPYPEPCTLGDLKWDGLTEGDSMFRYSASGAPREYKWDGTKWADPMRPTLDTTSLELKAGQAMLLNKVSPGVGTVSLKQ